MKTIYFLKGVYRSYGSDKGAALDPPSGGTRRVAEGASFSCPLWGSVCRSHSIKGRVVFSPLRSENLHPLALDSVPAYFPFAIREMVEIE